MIPYRLLSSIWFPWQYLKECHAITPGVQYEVQCKSHCTAHFMSLISVTMATDQYWPPHYVLDLQHATVYQNKVYTPPPGSSPIVQVAIRLTAPTIFLYALSLPSSCAGSDWLLVFRLVYLAWLSSLLSSLFVAAVAAAVSCHSNILRDKQWKTCWHTVYIKLASSYQLNSL